ncbi:unnamed protein product [Hermetia illucens]|uniref:DNA/RNA-binding protein Alba-like domain-containing protein n=1 Tax=Hermetia illucens TaxID=343691 RepID=A0A7R8YP12_HERIL|nr:ribonuclease P protein subunit p25-like protein [Hermetia illucens]XP_037903405.1 ribonuclease P protein subunit p25-like protein [Hermetia illucens]CAD7076901.1 unnamed protein product [Hermetia illucens]
MMHYKKGKNVEEELTRENIPIECLPADYLWMHVKGGTKVSNVLEFAKKTLDNGEHRSIVWSGSGGGVGKTISCAEILKRNYPIHQVTRLCYRKVEEYWEPQMPGLEEIVATRQIPCIHILTTLDELDKTILGYQDSKTKTSLWIEREAKPRGQQRNSQPGGSGENKKKFRQGQGQGSKQNRKSKHQKDQSKDNSRNAPEKMET